MVGEGVRGGSGGGGVRRRRWRERRRRKESRGWRIRKRMRGKVVLR